MFYGRIVGDCCGICLQDLLISPPIGHEKTMADKRFYLYLVEPQRL
jgi:hypothetical protein